jgi:eukaryotic-like serine/threonine-protein kinase
MLTAAVEGLGRIPVTNPWELANARYSLATVYRDQNRWHEAELLLRKVEQQHREESGPQAVTVAQVQADLGRALLEQNKFAEAEGVLRECLAIRAAKLPGQWKHYHAQNLLGKALAGQRKFVEAEQQLLAAEKGLAKLDPRDNKDKQDYAKRLRECREQLVRLYQVWERPKDAAEWQAKLRKPGDLPLQ